MVGRRSSPSGRRAPRLIDELVHTVLATVDMQEVLERTGALLRSRFGDTRVSIHRIVEDQPDQIEIVHGFDPRTPQEGVGRRVPLAGSLCGEVVRLRQPAVIHRLDADPPPVAEARHLAPLGYRALASFPLVIEDRVIGTLDLAAFQGSRLLREHWDEAELVANVLAIALNNSRAVEEASRLARLLRRENRALRTEARRAHAGERFVAVSPLMLEVVKQLDLVAPSDATVLLRGETGTGKEGLARRVHDRSPRRDHPFVVVNLGAVPESLAESELFGHEKGAFTGAAQRREGYFEAADGGTIFLDEIGDASPAIQVRLLRVLQAREIQRVGSSEPVHIDVRVVAATNRSLEQMVEEGTFRSDLYYRLSTFPLLVPPLRERREDLGPLAEYFLERSAADLHRSPPRLEPADLRRLEAYPWPGNVRELQNVVTRAVILSPGSRLVLPPLVAEAGPAAPRSGATRAEPVPRFDEAVTRLLREALEQAEGRIHGPRGAAALLGLRPTTLQGKLRRYGIGRGRGGHRG